MPYRIEHFDAEMRLSHAGIDVFCTYEDGAIWRYWYSTDPEGGNEFDARQFARISEGTPTVAAWEEWWKPRFKTEDEAIDALIIAAIEDGRVTAFSANKGGA